MQLTLRRAHRELFLLTSGAEDLPEIEFVAAQRFRDTQYFALPDDSPPDLARFQSWQQDRAIWVAVDGQGFLIENVILGN